MIPKSELPTYEVKLPSNGREVTIRPFTVKEEKILLMAVESGDTREIIRTTKQIIANCVLTEGIDIEKMPFFDVDYLFIALRAKSVGETIEVKFKCNNKVGEEICGNIFPAKVDIANVLTKDAKIDPKIRISNLVSVKMRYPSYSVMKQINDNDNILNKKIAMILGSIEYIQEKDRFLIVGKDITKDELNEFVEGLTQEQFKKLEEFIDNFPVFVIETTAKCGKCGFDHRLEYSDFAAFFV